METMIVALKNSKEDQKLLAYAKYLKRRFRVRLHLTHCFQGSLGVIPGVIDNDQYLELMQYSYDAALRTARETLESQALALGDDVTYRVVVGGPVESLLAEVEEQNAKVLLLGSAGHGYRFFPRGFSVPLSLLSESRVPVIVYSDACEDDWKDQPLKVVCADDLSETNPLVGLTSLLTPLLDQAEPGISLTHIHVNPLTEDTIKHGIQGAIAASGRQLTSAIDAREIFRDLDRRIKGEMQKRIPSDLQSKMPIHTLLLHGDPGEEITKFLADKKHSLAVFGRHKVLHKRPFYFGQFPFATAYKLHVPFIVIPTSTNNPQ